MKPKKIIKDSIDKLETLRKKAKGVNSEEQETTYTIFHVFINNDKKEEDKKESSLASKIKSCITKLNSRFK